MSENNKHMVIATIFEVYIKIINNQCYQYLIKHFFWHESSFKFKGKNKFVLDNVKHIDLGP